MLLTRYTDPSRDDMGGLAGCGLLVDDSSDDSVSLIGSVMVTVESKFSI